MVSGSLVAPGTASLGRNISNADLASKRYPWGRGEPIFSAQIHLLVTTEAKMHHARNVRKSDLRNILALFLAP